MTDEDQLNKSDSDIDENEDSIHSNTTTDDEFYNELMSVTTEHEDCLICDGCKDEIQGIEHLALCLNRRYDSSPVIFVGTLKDAIKTSWNSKDIRERRPLLIYINNDKSLYSNLFCKQLLCNETIIEYLLNNYVLWAWDVTYPSNGETLNTIYRSAFARYNTDENIGQKPIEQYPLLIGIVRQTNGDYEFQNLIHGAEKQPTVDEFLARLYQHKEQFDVNEENYENEKLHQNDFFLHTHSSRNLPMSGFSHATSLFENVHPISLTRFISQIDPSVTFQSLDDDEQTPTVENLSPKFPK